MKKLLFVATLLLTGTFVFAHETQVLDIAGTDYIFVVGSLNEPVVVGDKTGIDLKIMHADQNDLSTTTSKAVTPVLGLEKTLKIQNIAINGATKDFDLATAWGKPGNYQTLFYPTNIEKFSYRIYGSIEGHDIDVTFTCNPEGHSMAKMNMDDMANGGMKNGNATMKAMKGGFGCFQNKDALLFPGGNSWKDTINNNLFGIISLSLLLVYIAQNRKRS